MKRTILIGLLIFLLSISITGCDEYKLTQQAQQSSQNQSQNVESSTSTPLPPASTQTNTPTEIPNTPTNTPTATHTPTATPTPTSIPLGPLSYPQGINPLSGLLAEEPQLLQWPPLLVSISNFPISARPQSGLSYSPFVYETYIGEGMTRYLAVFYGGFPQKPSESSSTPVPTNTAPGGAASDEIGPIRSGRLVYEQLRKQNNGFVIMVSGFDRVRNTISYYKNVFGTDEDGAGSMLTIDGLKEIGEYAFNLLGTGYPAGLYFDAKVPEGGKLANKVWLAWSYRNQVWWVYDAPEGVYRRFQDQADGLTFVEQTDALTGEALGFENVVFLFAEHYAETELIYLITLTGVTNGNALIVRDGQIYPVFWTSQIGEYEETTKLNRPIRYYDENGNPFPLKPGQTWVEIMPTTSLAGIYETMDTYDWGDLVSKNTPGSGIWAVRFYAPPVAK